MAARIATRPFTWSSAGPVPTRSHPRRNELIEDPKFLYAPVTYSRTWIAGQPDEEIHEYSCSENNVDRDHLGFGPGPIRKDGTRGYDNPAPLLPPLPAPPKK